MVLFLSSSKQEVTMQKKFDFPPKILYENRYCNQDGFSVLVCGGINLFKTGSKPVKSVFKLHNTDFKCEKYIDMPKALYACKTVVIDSDLFVFGGYLQNGLYDSCVRKFCSKTKTWSIKQPSDIQLKKCSICTFK